MTTQLTDEEIVQCLVEANSQPEFYSAIDIARAVIAAHEAKQREGCEPEGWIVYLPSQQSQYLYDSQDDLGYVDDLTNNPDAEVTPLYTHPSEDARDAARYRWLRNGGIYSLGYKDHGAGPEFNHSDDLDAEIDAAIAKESAK